MTALVYAYLAIGATLGGLALRDRPAPHPALAVLAGLIFTVAWLPLMAHAARHR